MSINQKIQPISNVMKSVLRTNFRHGFTVVFTAWRHADGPEGCGKKDYILFNRFPTNHISTVSAFLSFQETRDLAAQCT